MEFLFTNQIASIEAILLFFCIGVIISIFAYDGYLSLRRVTGVMFPKRISSPLPEVFPPADVTSFEGVKESVSSPSDEGVIIPHEEEASLVVPEVTLEVPPETESEKNREEISLVNEENTLESEVVKNPPSPLDTSEGEIMGEKSATETQETPADIPTDVPILDEKKEEMPPETLESASEKKEEKNDTLKIKDDSPLGTEQKKNIRPDKRDKLVDIQNNAKTLIARGQVDEARALIVNGLSLDKNHRELNILMASLYEKDHAFKKAEYILKDIAENFPDDIEVLTHLATDLAMQGKYDVSYELYKRILILGDEGEETLYTLTHLASEMNLPLDVTLYARAYLKKFPHNPEILWLYGQSQIANGERKQAIETLIKLKNLTPYNQEIADLIQKLVTEEELAGNFGGEKN